MSVRVTSPTIARIRLVADLNSIQGNVLTANGFAAQLHGDKRRRSELFRTSGLDLF